MADWVVCPTCRLKHSRRESGLCPKCGSQVTGGTVEVHAPPERPRPPPIPVAPSFARDVPSFAAITGAKDPARAAVSTGARIAGAVLIVNALLVTIERLVMGTTGSDLANSPIPGIIDLLIGGSLLSNKARFLTWAQIRVVLGALLFTGIHVARGENFLAAFQLLFSLALLGLLLGIPSRARIGAAMSAVSLYFLLEGFGLAVQWTGRNPLARVLQANRYEPRPVAVLTGRAFPYQLRCPPGWYAVKPAIARQENQAMDAWISKPDRDAHVYVIAEQLEPGAIVDMDAFERIYIENVRKTTLSLQVAAPPKVTTKAESSRFVHTITKIKEGEIETYAGLFAEGNRIAQVIALAPRKHFAEMEAELRTMLGSFTMSGTAPGLSASLNPRRLIGQ